MLVHGEVNAMFRLKSALQSRFSEKEENVKIHTPKNCETVKLHFRGEKMAKVSYFLWEQRTFCPAKDWRVCKLDYWTFGSQISYRKRATQWYPSSQGFPAKHHVTRGLEWAGRAHNYCCYAAADSPVQCKYQSPEMASWDDVWYC